MKRTTIAVAVFAALLLATTPVAAQEPTKSKVVTTGTLTPASQPAAHPAPAIPDDDAKGAVERGKEAAAAAKDGRWWYFAALVVTLLMFLLKFIGKRVGFWAKMGRWRYVLPPALSLVAALLAAFQGGITFDAAMGVFTSSYATSSLQELWEHGILNKPRASAGG